MIPKLVEGMSHLFGIDTSEVVTVVERGHQVRTAIAIALPVAIIFSFFNFAQGYEKLAHVEGAASALLLLAVYLQMRSETRVAVAEWLTIAWAGLVTAALTVYGGVEGSGVLWIFAFPFLAFFLRGQRLGWLISAGWIAFCMLARAVAPLIPDAWTFSPDYTWHLLGSMIWATGIAAAFNLVRSRFMILLNERVAANTAKAREYLEKLQYLALHDELTGLPNRAGILQQLEAAIAECNHDREVITVIDLRLERLLEITNILGEDGGNRLLRSVGARFHERFGQFGKLARTRTDEFVAFYKSERQNATPFRLKHALEEIPMTFDVDDFPIHLEHTIGTAEFPAHADKAEDLLRKAEQALLQARAAKVEISVYDDRLDALFIRRNRLFGQLREALNRNELELWFQPQMDLRSGRIVGAEALARWRKANGEFVPPSEFVPVAEQSGLIKPFTKWVLRAFFKEVGKWQAAGLDLHYSANLSARNLADPEILVDLASLLVKEGVNANHVVLELTESSFAEHPEQLMKMATQLNAMSFRQSIDDFGTGYSSLSYLKDLPVDELKIDQSFIRNLLQDESSAAIVKSTIQLAHNLGLKVVAEGIETPEVAAALLAAGCDIGQGYHFSKALPPAEFAAFARAAL
jgi:diguanylate cyclase (GGDEF)-like protein